MKKEIAEAIVDAGSRFYDLKVFEGYSGRGMFGETTTGVVFGNLGELLAAIAWVVYYIDDYGFDLVDLISALEKLRFDELGLKKIVY